MRDVPNRYQGLPPRSAEMLHKIVRKFYRGAVSHYELIQEKKAEVRAASEQSRVSEDVTSLRQALTILFLEFHFYTTCWLQIELASYRLSRKDEAMARVREAFQPDWEKHLAVREYLEQTEACVQAQFEQESPIWEIVEQDAYRFGEHHFSVDEHQLHRLHAFYQAIENARQEKL